MSIIPLSWIEETNVYNTYYSFQESVVISYLNYLRSEELNLNPKSCSIYLSGVRFMLENIGVDTSFINRSMAIKRTKTGIEKLYRKEKGNLECDVGCKPLFWAAIVAFAVFTALFPTKLNKIKSKALEFGYITLSRPNEIFKTAT